MADGYNMVVDSMKEVSSQIDELKASMDLGPITEEQTAQLQALEGQYFNTFIALNDESTAFYQDLISKNDR